MHVDLGMHIDTHSIYVRVRSTCISVCMRCVYMYIYIYIHVDVSLYIGRFVPSALDAPCEPMPRPTLQDRLRPPSQGTSRRSGRARWALQLP